METDVLIVGSGLAGLHTALSLSSECEIVVITNSKIRDCNSYLAQGGITTVKEEDRELFTRDTMEAGGGESSLEAIGVVGDESMKYLARLLEMGVEFERDGEGNLKFTREAAHSINRIAYRGSETGKAIMETLIEQVGSRGNIKLIEECHLLDLAVTDNSVEGALVEIQGRVEEISCRRVVLATGGIGGLFATTTNNKNIDGIALALAKRYSIETRDLGYIQFHPTALHSEGEGKMFLLSEALRGEGALLIDHRGERFVDELQPRDVVARAIMEKLKEGRVYLDATGLEKEYLKERFRGIYEECLKRGHDITREPLPVRPAQHYYMGGLAVDSRGRTSCDNLYAVGEVSCTGLHGRNRLASNSLLEALVYSGRAAEDIEEQLEGEAERKRYEGTYTGRLIRNYTPWAHRGEAREIILREREDLRDELSVS